MENRKVLILLSLIILLGIFLRVYNIGEESFWIDEAATVYTTQQSPLEIIEDIYTTTKQAPQYYEGGGSPPFYFLVANYWTNLVGLSEAKLRLLSAIFGTISIFMIFTIGRMLFGYRVGLIVAFMLAINFMHINYSQEARGYSLVVLLTLFTVYFLINGLNGKKNAYWLGYSIAGALLLYTHYFGFFILFFEALYVLIFFKQYKNSLKKAVVSAIGIFVLYIPWIPALFRQIADSEKLAWYLGKGIIYDFARIFVQFNAWLVPDAQTRVALRGVYASVQNFSIKSLFGVSLIGWLAIASILALTLMLLWYFIIGSFVKNRKLSVFYLKDKNRAFLLMWFVIPILVPMIITIVMSTTPVFGFVQYTLFASPAYYLLAAIGISKTKKYYILLTLIVVLSLLPLYSYYSNFDKQQWREVAQYLEANRLPGELVTVHAHHSILAMKYYYKDMNRVLPVKNVEDLTLTINNENSVWLVYSSEKFFDPEEKIKKYLDDNYKKKSEIEFTGVRIFHYIK